MKYCASATPTISIPTAQVQTILCVGDTAGSLDGKYFILYDESGSVGFWFDVDNNGTSAPAEATACDRAVEITTVATGDSAATVAGKVATAIDADSKFVAPAPGAATVTVTNTATQDISNGSAGDSGFTVTTTVEGVSAYSSGDRMGTVMTLSPICEKGGDLVSLESILIVDKAGISKAIDIMFFSSSPTIASADNAALDISDANMALCIGHVSVAAANYVTSASSSIAYLKDVNACMAPASTSIYALAVIRATSTYLSTTDLTFTFVFNDQAN